MEREKQEFLNQLVEQGFVKPSEMTEEIYFKTIFGEKESDVFE